jgi:histidine triad (HIT) family protein
MSDCLFCKIVNGELESKLVHEDERCVAFEDIAPQAPTHVLVVPREHIATLNDLQPEHEALVGHLLAVGRSVARKRGHGESGYRTVINCQEGAGQSVFHLHVHVLGGRRFGWPPG